MTLPTKKVTNFHKQH